MLDGLIAICGDRRTPSLKRVLLDDTIRRDVREIFREQEEEFVKGCSPIPFDGNWKCDGDQYMELPVSSWGKSTPASILVQAVNANEPHLEVVNSLRLEEEDIRGLAISVSDRLLVQRYVRSQTIRPGKLFVPGPDGVKFRRLESSAMSFDSHLTCVVKDGVIRFKSVSNLSRIIDMTDFVREATNIEVEAFANHPLIDTIDIDGFLLSMGQVARKLIHSIQTSQILEGQDVEMLGVAANRCGYTLPVTSEGRIQMPSATARIKEVLDFLNENRFIGAITGQRYVTNSRRAV